MNELTDLEICKRIADIENQSVMMMKSSMGEQWVYMVDDHGGYRPYNPLTDKALCFDLMLRYGIHLVGDRQKGYWAEPWIEKEPPKSGAFDENPQRAICLAIIAKHK